MACEKMSVSTKELMEATIKRAMGFSYTEVVKEYEEKKEINYFYCEKRNRIYFKSGNYLKVHYASKNDFKILSIAKFVSEKATKFKNFILKLEKF